MSDQQQNFNADDALGKAKDYAKEHPDQARGAINKLEEAINEKTGGMYKDVIEKGGEYLEEAFGIPSDVSANPPEEPRSEEPRTEQPADPAPDEQPAPADSDAAPPSTPDDTQTTPDDGTSPKTLPPFDN